MMPNRRLVCLTVSTGPGKYFDTYAQSAKFHGLDCRVLGWGQKWRGWGWRAKLVHEAIQGLEDECVVLVSDSQDAFFTGSAQAIIEAFETFGAPCVISAENHCGNKVARYAHRLMFNPTGTSDMSKEFSLHCAGAFIGTARYLKTLMPALRALIKKYHDDQVAFTHLQVQNPTDIVLDHNCSIFQTISQCLTDKPMKLYSLRATGDGTLWNLKYNTKPQVVHGPGSANLCEIQKEVYGGKLEGAAACSLTTPWQVERTRPFTKRLILAPWHTLALFLLLGSCLVWLARKKWSRSR